MLPLLLVAALLGQQVDHRDGHLIVAGGGTTIPEITDRALAVSGGRKAHVLLIPQASNRPVEAGLRSAAWWRQAGAEHVEVLDLANRANALAAVRHADLIWMGGGSQGLLIEALRRQPGVVELIRERYHHGATVGGTSAGAAVISAIMLTGEAQIDRLVDGTTKVADGLGLWPDVIVDQHYLKRVRFNRLLSAVLDHPEDVGIGIDECTAIIVQGRSFEVIGRSNVVVIDARKTPRFHIHMGEPEAASNVSLHVLRAGMRFDLDRGVLPDWNDKMAMDKAPAERARADKVPMGKAAVLHTATMR